MTIAVKEPGAWKAKLKKINDNIYELPMEGDMNVPGRIFVNDKLMEELDEGCIIQVRNVATLPGIYKYSISMPDAHQGYGFSIGGVAAFDAENGCISPGGVGFDINCGVRLLTTPLKKEEATAKIQEFLTALFRLVPCGIGSKGGLKLSPGELDHALRKGARWAVENKFGIEADIEHCEENGGLKYADPSLVSATAKKRGGRQLGTLGAGNHFLEIQFVDEIYDKETAAAFGIKEKGQVTVMIHCGSRGFGHQVCSDYLREMEQTLPEIVHKLPDKDLVYAPAGSPMAMKYFKAMCAAANYAWCNRHIIGHKVRDALREVFGLDESEVKTMYDVAHNIAKLETHIIDGKERKVYMHRKGATRSFPPGHPEIPEAYRKVGQPVIIPGSMGTASYVLVGTKEAMEQSFGSAAHGAGRAMSRHAATAQFRGETVKQELERQNIYVKSASWKGISEEAPRAYKDIDEVIKVSHETKLAKMVARLRPIGVIKG